jgi:hypothetical protein
MPIGTAWYDTFISIIQLWMDDLELAPGLIGQWVLMAEERFNNELRCREMIVTRSVTLDHQCVPLPADFLEMVALRYTGSGLPVRYISPDEYSRLRSAAEFYLSGPQTTAITYLDPQTGAPLGPLPRQPAFVDYPGRAGPELPLARNSYTLLGNVLHVHPTVAGPDAAEPTTVELTYYAKVPPLPSQIDAPPLYLRAPKLYTYGTLSQASTYLVEDQRLMVWDGTVTALIKAMNDNARTERVVSSPILMQVRSFG